MKYLVLLVIVFSIIWWIRQQRRPRQTPRKETGPHIMVACVHCGTLIPEDDAIRGAHGAYCSQAHHDLREN